MRFEKLLLAAAALCLVCMAPACSDDDPATDPNRTKRPERRVRGREIEMTTPENPGNPILPTHPH